MTQAAAPFTARDISDVARRICRDQRGAERLLQIYRPFICPFEEILPHVPEGAQILDVGCGGGLFLGLAAETGRLSGGIGFDANPTTIASAHQLRLESDTVEFRHLDVEEPWPEGPFDVVSMIDVMHHIPPAAQPGIFAQVAARLKPGGLFLYKDINARDVIRASANRLHDLVLAQDWVHYLPTPRAQTLAAEAGFAEERYAKINRFWYGHDLHIFRRTA